MQQGQGLTINAYQDGNRLIISFENAPDALQTAIISMLGGVIKHSIDGLAPVSEPNYEEQYEKLAKEVNKQETLEQANVPIVETASNNVPVVEQDSELKEESGTQTVKNQDKVETAEAPKKRYAFFEGEYKDMSPEEALDKDKLKALSVFYNKRSERPYNSTFMKKVIKTACRDYINKITENLVKTQVALDWLFENYREGTSQILNDMRYEASKAGIQELCKKESPDLCKTTIVMLFNKMIEEM